MALIILANGSAPAGPGPKDRPQRTVWSIGLALENDALTGTDGLYTSGVSLGISQHGRTLLDPAISRLAPALVRGQRRAAYQIGQIIYTPSDIRLAVPDPNDRPYAGLLYLAVGACFQDNGTQTDLRLITGVVGPSSLAGQVQRSIHQWTNSPEPMGWAYQLRDEPIINLIFDRRQRTVIAGQRDDLAVEAIPGMSLAFGNALIQAQIGGQLRAGLNLPDDFGTSLIQGLTHLPPPAERAYFRGLGVYAYAAADISVVLRNITLDGNTWRTGPSVQKLPLVPAAEMGLGIATRHLHAIFSYVMVGKEFRAQATPIRYASIGLTYVF